MSKPPITRGIAIYHYIILIFIIGTTTLFKVGAVNSFNQFNLIYVKTFRYFHFH